MNSGIASKDIFAKDAERRTEQFVVVVFIVIGIATTLRFAFHFPISRSLSLHSRRLREVRMTTMHVHEAAHASPTRKQSPYRSLLAQYRFILALVGVVIVLVVASYVFGPTLNVETAQGEAVWLIGP
jgi:hypothetical protein